MMVDGSPRRIAAPAQNANNSNSNNNNNNNNSNTSPQAADDKNGQAGDSNPLVPGNAFGTGVGNETKSSEAATSGSAAPSSSSGNQGDVNRSSRSRWLKLRTTVQLSGAITQVHKKPPLKREDSFLKRFSTRHITDPCSVDGSARRGENSKGGFLGSWRSVVNPDENILFYWLSLLTACLLYNAWTIIVRQAFPEFQERLAPVWYTADAFSDVVFLLDIAFQFRTGYLEQGLMVYESKKLAGHYFRSRSFLMDIAAITPLDLVQLRVGVFPLVRFPRFLKVYRSFRFYYMVESRTIYPNLWRVVNLIHILLLLAHWFGCFYYMLSELEDFVGEWSYHRPVDDYSTLTRKYLGSVYWSTLTLTTIGDLATPATNLQYLFTIISYLIGVFIFATIVGQVGNVITNRNASRLEFERLLDGAKLYMRHHKVPRNMQRRVQRWYDYSWSRGRMQGGGDINSALGILPDKLKTELALHVNLKTLKKVSIFQECQPEFLHDLVLKMKAYIFTPGDLICRKGEVAREMFIIADGVLEVISESGKVLTQMKAGDFFGEIGILNLDGFNRRTADVRSVGYSELFSLSREDILAAMKDYPEAQEILQTMGRKRLMEARLAANMSKNPKEEAPPTSNKRSASGANIDLTKRVLGAQRPRTAVGKFKYDVKKLLRSRSTPTGKTCLATSSEEQVEMKPIPRRRETDKNLPEDIRLSPRKRKSSLSNLMRKIKGDSECTPARKTRLPNMRTQLRNSEQLSSRTDSTVSAPTPVDSTEVNTPLNKALPLLQRIRLLGEQERSAAAAKSAPAEGQSSTGITANSIKPPPLETADSEESHEVIGEGLPLLERLKLLRAREQAKPPSSLASSKDSSPGSGVVHKTKQQTLPQKDASHSQHALQKKSSSLTSRLASVMGTTKPNGQTSGSTRDNTSAGGTERPTDPQIKSRSTDMPSELPLLKKVLLMKIMEDKSSADVHSEKNAQDSTTNPMPPATHPKEGSLRPTNPQAGVATASSSAPTARSSKLQDPGEEHKSRPTVATKTLTRTTAVDEKQRATATTSNTTLSDTKTNRVSSGIFRLPRDSERNRSDAPQTSTEKSQVQQPKNVLNTASNNDIAASSATGTTETQQKNGVPQAGGSGTTSNCSEQGRSSRSGSVPSDKSTIDKETPNSTKLSPETDHDEHKEDTEPSPPKQRERKDSTTAELLQSKTKEGYLARKGKLSRMMALREDSDEHPSESTSEEDRDLDESSDDPFVKNIECQTEVHRSTSTSPDTWSPQQSARRFKLEDAPFHFSKRNRRGSAAAKNTAPEKPKQRIDGMDFNDDAIFSDDGIQDYLVKVMKHVKQIIKSYVVEQQQELQTRITALEKEIKEKDAIIRRLKMKAYAEKRSSEFTRTSSTFDEISSLDISSLSTSESGEEVEVFSKAENATKKRIASVSSAPGGENAETDEDMMDQEDERLLKIQQSMPKRKSWTCGGCDGDISKLKSKRKQLLSARQSYSLDDERSQNVLSGYKADELWKLEFPVSEQAMRSSTLEVSRTVHTVPVEEEEEEEDEEEDPNEYSRILPAGQNQYEQEKKGEEEKLSAEVIKESIQRSGNSDDEFDISAGNITAGGGNDWEVQMLVQQFEKNMRQQKRRHSSGEVLSWQAVLGGRGGISSAISPTGRRTETSVSPGEKKGRRKFSLVEEKLPLQWSASQKPKHRSLLHLAVSKTSKHAVYTTCSKTKLSPGEGTDSASSPSTATEGSSHVSLASEKKSNIRRRLYRYRRQNSFSESKPSQQPRKASLPTADSLNNIYLARLAGADGVGSISSRRGAQTVHKRAGQSGAGVDVDQTFGSLEDVSRISSSKKYPWPRSPSSPNFPTDQRFWGPETSVPEHSIPEWPSSPCLPTITEDDHSLGASVTSSPCRSFSHDCIPTLPQCSSWQGQISTSATSWTTATATSSSKTESRFVFPPVRQTGDGHRHCSVKSSTDHKAQKFKEEHTDDSRFLPFAQSREDSVVIAIPECEPLLSPR